MRIFGKHVAAAGADLTLPIGPDRFSGGNLHGPLCPVDPVAATIGDIGLSRGGELYGYKFIRLYALIMRKYHRIGLHSLADFRGVVDAPRYHRKRVHFAASVAQRLGSDALGGAVFGGWGRLLFVEDGEAQGEVKNPQKTGSYDRNLRITQHLQRTKGAARYGRELALDGIDTEIASHCSYTS